MKKVSRVFSYVSFLIYLLSPVLKAQKTYFGDNPIAWDNYSAIRLPAAFEKFATNDLVYLSDETSFSFYSSANEKLSRHLLIKINTAKGLEKIQALTLPESFDPAYDARLKQGRGANATYPFILDYNLQSFAARKYSNLHWAEIEFDLKYKPIKWSRKFGDQAGELVKDELYLFQLKGLRVGDVLEVYYEANFISDYGSNLFYLNSFYPKLNSEYSFTYKVPRNFGDFSFILPINVPDSCYKRELKNTAGFSTVTEKLKFSDLHGINYPDHSFRGKKLPYAYADFRFYRATTNSYPDDGGRTYDYVLFRPRHFEWVIMSDTTNYYTKIYDKQFAAIRKFVGKLPPVIGPDSSSTLFLKALCDTFNDFRFVSSEQMFYNEPGLMNVYSGEHLLKRRIVEHLQWKLYSDLMNDTKLFYYVANVQDKRFGEHTLKYRACFAYERALIAVPTKDSYVYFMPRYNGLKYHLNELPFYLEGSLAALSPKNFQAQVKDKDEKFFKFLKTHQGTYNENTRTENAQVKISLDSLKAGLSIKESLSGQFSTVLRHLYLNEYIDSSISANYFKKCTEKPNASGVKIKFSSKMTDFPFRYNFNCSERIALQDAKKLPLKNWFSFVFSKTSIPEKPNHAYYFDFDFSDSYNFMLDFDVPVELSNAAAFGKKINNDYFELESEIIKNSERTYLLKVKLLVKQSSLPEEKLDLMMELLKELEELNNFSLDIQKV